MDRIYYQQVLVPAGTLESAPVSVTVLLEDNQLSRIDCIVPDGHCGLTGIRLVQSQQQVFPWSNFSYVVANDEKITIEYEDQIQASGITAVGFNTDIFDHSFYFRFTITNLPYPGAEAEAEVVAPGSQSNAFFPESDSFDINSIIGNQTNSVSENAAPLPTPTPTPIPSPPVIPPEPGISVPPVKVHPLPRVMV